MFAADYISISRAVQERGPSMKTLQGSAGWGGFGFGFGFSLGGIVDEALSNVNVDGIREELGADVNEDADLI
jgi:hypothetical protein